MTATVIPFPTLPARPAFRPAGAGQVVELPAPAVRLAIALRRLRDAKAPVSDARGAGFTFRRQLRALCEGSEALAAVRCALSRCDERTAVAAYRQVNASVDQRAALSAVRKLRRAA